MATVAQNIETLNTIKNNIKNAINNKGVTVTDGDSFTTYASKIDEIETGGAAPVLESITITSNGIYTPPSGVDGYNEVSVNVTTGGDSTNYSYYNGSVDEAGLRAIGWDDESIGYLRDNALHYAWQNSDYIVSEENKALYGVVNSNNVSTYRDNKNMIYVPYFEGLKESMYGIFLNLKHIKGVPLFEISETIKSLNNMFEGCSALETIPPLDTSNVTKINRMFYNCSNLTHIPQLNTSNVTNMNGMFNSCSSLETIPLLDTSKVTNISSMFNNCTSLKTIPPLDTSNVTNMNSMFSNCSSIATIPYLNTSNVTNMNNIFQYCTLLETIPELDTSNITNMSYMFYNCTSLKTIPPLDTSNVVNINYIFGFSDITTLTDVGGFKNLKINWNDNYGLVKCPNLTYESIMNVINNLYNFRGNGDDSTTRTLKINSNTYALLTDENIALASSKGWTISA